MVLRLGDSAIHQHQRAGVLHAVLVLTGTGDLHFFGGKHSFIVDAVFAGICDLQSGNAHIALVIVINAVLSRAVDGHIRGVQRTGIVQAVVLRSGNTCFAQHHCAVILNAVASCTGIQNGNIGGSHGGLVADTVFGNIVDLCAVYGHGSTGLIVDTVHLRASDGYVGDRHLGRVVDTLLAGFGDGHILQHQLALTCGQVEAVGNRIGNRAAFDCQRTSFHISAVVAHRFCLQVLDDCIAILVLNGILIGVYDGQVGSPKLAALVINAVAAQVFHRDPGGDDHTAVQLEAALLRVLNGHIGQLHSAACIHLNCCRADVFDRAVIQVQLAAVGIYTVLFTLGTLNGHVVKHRNAAAHGDGLIPADTQGAALNRQVTAGNSYVAVQALGDGGVRKNHITGEVVNGHRIAVHQHDVCSADLTAVVCKAVGRGRIHNSLTKGQFAGGIVHDAALVQLYFTGSHSAIIAKTVVTLGNGAAGHIGSSALRYQQAVLLSTDVGAAGHGVSTGCHIYVMNSRLGNRTAGLLHRAGRIDGSASQCAGNFRAAKLHCAVVDNVVGASVQQLAAAEICRAALCNDQVGIAAVLNSSVFLKSQGAACT